MTTAKTWAGVVEAQKGIQMAALDSKIAATTAASETASAAYVEATATLAAAKAAHKLAKAKLFCDANFEQHVCITRHLEATLALRQQYASAFAALRNLGGEIPSDYKAAEVIPIAEYVAQAEKEMEVAAEQVTPEGAGPAPAAYEATSPEYEKGGAEEPAPAN